MLGGKHKIRLPGWKTFSGPGQRKGKEDELIFVGELRVYFWLEERRRSIRNGTGPSKRDLE